MATAPAAGYAGELRIYRDAEQLASAAAELFVEVASESIKTLGRFRAALSGGSTPRRMYQLLATPAFRDRVDWNRVDLFWGDERYVASYDRDSNYRMAAEALLRHVRIPLANVHRVPSEIRPPTTAAVEYEEDIRQCFRNYTSAPRFDLIYLGLGANGHTASLFPHSPALKEDSRLVVADFVAEANAWRISMSAVLLNRGRAVAFLVAGQQKAQVLRDVLLSPQDPERLPAQLIAPEGELLWMVDEAAATRMSYSGESRTAEKRSA